MSLSAEPTLEQLKEIIEDEKKTDNDARDVQEQVVDGEGFVNQDNSSLVLNTVRNGINNEFEP